MVGNTAFDGSSVIVVVNAFTFTKDGKFTTDKAVSASGFNEPTNPGGPPAVVATSSRSSSGTYVLDGYTLELRWSNKRVERRGFVWLNQKEKDSIYINGTVYLLEK